MKKTLITLALAAVAVLSGCAGIRPVDRKAVLRAELAKWENFSSEGVIEATYTGLTLRKMFALSKTKEDARLDVLGGGAFGVNPQPLVSVYLGDYFALQSPLMPQLESIAQARVPADLSLDILSDPDSLIARYGDEIINTGKLTHEGMELTFSPDLQLTKVTDSQSGAEVNISYTGKGDPDEVLISLGDVASLRLLMDKTTYGEAEVIPLPQPEPNNLLEETLRALEELLPPQGETQP